MSLLLSELLWKAHRKEHRSPETQYLCENAADKRSLSAPRLFYRAFKITSPQKETLLRLFKTQKWEMKCDDNKG